MQAKTHATDGTVIALYLLFSFILSPTEPIAMLTALVQLYGILMIHDSIWRHI
jgi:hypothetical protein